MPVLLQIPYAVFIGFVILMLIKSQLRYDIEVAQEKFLVSSP